MNSMTLWIILAVVVLVALYLYNRSRPAPRGTYDDPNVRSSGSIGGRSTDERKDEPARSQTTQSQPDETVKPTHDDPNFKSGGSFGT